MKFGREAVHISLTKILSKSVHSGKFSLFYQFIARWGTVGDSKDDFVVMELKLYLGTFLEFQNFLIKVSLASVTF